MPRTLIVLFCASLLACGPDASAVLEEPSLDDTVEGGLSGAVAVGAVLEVKSATTLKARRSASSPTLAPLPVGSLLVATARTPTAGYYAVSFDGQEGFVLGSKLKLGTQDAGVPPEPGGALELTVAPDGLDSNPGTVERPLATLQRAVDLVGTREGTITVRGGTYRGRVVLRGSGSASEGRLTLRAAPGERPIIDGTGLPVRDQQGLVDIDSRSQVTLEGFEVRNFRSPSSSGVPVGIYVHGRGTGLTVRGNEIHHIVQARESCNGGDAFGIAVYGDQAEPWTNVVFDGNEIHSTRTGCSETFTLNGNVDGFLITNNFVHDVDNIGIDIIGFEGTGPTAAVDQARNGVIRGNRIRNVTSRGNPGYGDETSAGGIYVDGGKNVLIEQNVIHDADIGIEIASEHAGKASSYVLVRSNVITGSRQAGLSIGGYDARRGSTHHCVFLNNSLYENTVEFQVQHHVSATRYQNNVAFNAAGEFTNGSLGGVESVSNVTRRASASGLFASAPEDLRLTDGSLEDTGTALATCPAGWVCPPSWSTPLHGGQDVANAPREQGQALDVGAYERAP